MQANDSAASNASDLANLYRTAPESVSFRKLRKRLLQQVREAISRFAMISEGAAARWLVCVSGGKDSYAMLTLLLDLRRQGLIDVDLLACNLDQGQPGFPEHVLPDFLSSLGVPFRIERRDTYAIVRDKIPEGRTFCSLCSRLRRGNLYRIAREEGCDAIVLGHHRDDAIETLLMNLFHGGRLASIPPKLLNDEGDLLVLRPLIMCAEDDLSKFARDMQFPIIPCSLCGSQEGAERASIKRLIASWEASHPGRSASLAGALSNLRPSHLCDASAFDFTQLRPGPADERTPVQPGLAASMAGGGKHGPETA